MFIEVKWKMICVCLYNIYVYHWNLTSYIFQLLPSSSMNGCVHQSVHLSDLLNNVSLMKFSSVITLDNCDIHAKGQGYRLKARLQRSNQILLQFGHFWNVIPVWIHRWLQNDAQSYMWHRRGAYFFFKFICYISSSHKPKKIPIWTWFQGFLTITEV